VNLYAQDLGASKLQLGLLGTAWALPYAFSCLFTGRWADKYDRTILLWAGLWLAALSHSASGLSTRPQHLIAAAPFGGLGCALFWPTFETLLHSDNPEETRVRIGAFNTGWTIGIMGGTAAAGYFYHLAGPRTAFFSIALIAALTGCYVLTRTDWRLKPAGAEHYSKSHQNSNKAAPIRKAGYLRLAWVANFGMWFAGSATNTIFPKLARSLSIPDGRIGLLSSLIMVAQMSVFILLSRSSKWHYRLTPLLAAQAAAVLGVLVIGLGRTSLAFAAGMLLLGISRGKTYSASLFYGLDAETSKGGNTGIHEAIVGAAYIAGPLAAGISAEKVSLRAPFFVTAAVVSLAVMLQIWIWSRMHPHSPPEPRQTPE
ncbi:MAG: MFS transporter, partial [Armatimonadota bacterium]